MKRTIRRILKGGWTNFLRNSYISVAVVGVMTLVLLLFLVLIAFQYLTQEAVLALEDKVDISAYITTETDEAKIESIIADLEKLPDVEDVEYITREQALENFKALHVNDDLIKESLEQLDENPLTASLNIKAIDPSRYANIAQFLEQEKFAPAIEKINFKENETVIGRIEQISKTIRNGGLITALVVACIAVLVTFNTIRLTIYNQRQEIEIMRLVGASNWHIRGPYLAEGGFYGVFGALIALVLFLPAMYVVSDSLANYMPGANVFDYVVGNLPQIVLLVGGSGVLLGVLSSVIAIRKHLKI